ncbi:MAG: CBS domain-containing protein [Desulfurococcales archaeon]|nr:CBS domain-containing protein [Desulfurococcales archaeon]
MVRVRDVMRRPATVSPSTRIIDAVKIMNEQGASSVVVVDDYGRPVGIFTERDLVRVVAEGVSLESEVGKVMTPNPITVKVDDPLSIALSKMAEHRIRNLPVVDSEGRLAGLITARDVTEVLKRYKEEVGEIE